MPKPRINLARYHGVFAPNSSHRAEITPSQRGKGAKKAEGTATTAELLDGKTYIEKRAAMTGFCSCKTGIHAIHGNNLGSTPEARVQY